jgi:hypothetical protein
MPSNDKGAVRSSDVESLVEWLDDELTKLRAEALETEIALMRLRLLRTVTGEAERPVYH